MPEQPQEESLLMKVLCALLLLLMAGVVTLTAFAQESYEGRPVYDATTQAPANKMVCPSLPIGPRGHSAIRKKSKRRLPLRRRRQMKVTGIWLESI